MKYKGYTASPRYDADDRIFHGRVDGITDVVLFEGASVEELEDSFRQSVDEYLAYCEEHGREPDRAYSGKFVLRLDPEVHQRVASAAARTGESINTWIAGACKARLDASEATRPKEISISATKAAHRRAS